MLINNALTASQILQPIIIMNQYSRGALDTNNSGIVSLFITLNTGKYYIHNYPIFIIILNVPFALSAKFHKN